MWVFSGLPAEDLVKAALIDFGLLKAAEQAVNTKSLLLLSSYEVVVVKQLPIYTSSTHNSALFRVMFLSTFWI